MAMNNPYTKYKKNQVFSAPPENLVLMLYDGLIRFAKEAIIAIEEKRIEDAHKAITRCKLIARELLLGLNREIPVADSLASLYNYMHERLVQANIKKDKAVLEEVIEMAAELRETWNEAILTARRETKK